MPDQVSAPPPWADLPAYREDYRKRCPLPDAALADLADRRQWLLWRFEPGETPEKKPRKMPYYATGVRRYGDQGSERDRERLVDFAAAIAAAKKGDFDGIGFAFLPGDGLIGIDLDGMIDPDTGEVSERCSQIVAACASYTEYSPSGKGVHIICAGETKTFKSNKVGVEVFCGRQYFTYSGRLWEGAPREVRPISEKTLSRLRVTVKGRPEAKPEEPPPAPAPAAEQFGGRVRSLAETAALAEEALGHVDPDEYEAWIRIGMALKAGLGAGGYFVWDGWSSRSTKYAGGDDTRRRWEGFRPSELSIGTVFALAEESGWVPPWVKARERKRRRAPPPAADVPPYVRDGDPGNSGETPPGATKAAAGGDGSSDDPPPDPGWASGLIRKNGRVLPCLANAELILAHVPEWDGVVAYDEFSERTVFRKPLPCNRRGQAAGEWTDHLDAMTAIWMQRAFRVEFSPSTVGQAVEVLARQHSFHPVREALAALEPWDGVRRLSEWLCDYLGVAHSPYTARVGTFFMRGMIKRVMEPGCKFDYCLVLEGEQGKGKSSVARILAWDWFCDTDLDLNNKDSLMALPGHWVYEIAELGSLMKAEERKQKSFLSRQEDEFRPPYGKRLIRVPRQCVFVGTTNEEEYLKDQTGGRRFWPVECGEEMNLDGLMAMRAQLFAEALHDYRQGERCWPTPEEQKELFNPEQAKRGMQEPFEDLLDRWIEKQVSDFTMSDAACDGLSLTPDKLTPAVVTRIGIALRKLGCVRRDRGSGVADKNHRRVYVSPKRHKAEMDLMRRGSAKATDVPANGDGRHEWF